MQPDSSLLLLMVTHLPLLPVTFICGSYSFISMLLPYGLILYCILHCISGWIWEIN